MKINMTIKLPVDIVTKWEEIDIPLKMLSELERKFGDDRKLWPEFKINIIRAVKEDTFEPIIGFIINYTNSKNEYKREKLEYYFGLKEFKLLVPESDFISGSNLYHI